MSDRNVSRTVFWSTLAAQSVCVHGDTTQAVIVAALLRQQLEESGVVIGAFS